MCDTCGCSQPAEAVTFRRPGTETPAHSHDHAHPHDHDHGHDHQHEHHHDHDHSQSREVKVAQDILQQNDLLAAHNRGWFAGRGILALNLVSSPGSGKTSVLERTISDLRETVPLSVIEGDQQTLRDADRIAATGAPVLQVNTGKGCHLDAAMIQRACDELKPVPDTVLMIENVGNLVCPALFDLGEAAKVVIISVTEGDDKPLKYPTMFAAADLCLINKIDLLPHVNFDVDACEAAARQVNPKLEFVRLAATTGEGMDRWYQWLRDRRAASGGETD